MENKENYDFLEKKNRTRGENWTREEKDIFLQIMAFSAPIIENKRTDTNTNKRKSLEWVKIKNKMKELTGVHREVSQLKGFWRRIKLMAKKNISIHRQSLPATDGVQEPPSTPPDDLCPMDFAVVQHIFDEISQFKTQETQDTEEIQNNRILKNEEVDEDIDEPAVLPKFEVEVTVADNHDSEVYGECSQYNNNTFKPKSPINFHQRNNMKKKGKYKNTSKASIIAANIELKKKATSLMEEEYALKIRYQKEEISHQKLRHKMEQDILLLQKLKLELEIDALKKKN